MRRSAACLVHLTRSDAGGERSRSGGDRPAVDPRGSRNEEVCVAQSEQQAKGPGGRPRLDAKERRCRQTNTRWTIAEDKQIRASAALAGISVGEYLRRRALDIPVVARTARADHRLAHELNAIGVNLNQLAKLGNVGWQGDRSAEFDELSRKLHKALDRVIEDLDD